MIVVKSWHDQDQETDINIHQPSDIVVCVSTLQYCMSSMCGKAQHGIIASAVLCYAVLMKAPCAILKNAPLNFFTPNLIFFVT